MKSISAHSWVLWLVATLFFSFQYILRLLPVHIMSETLARFNVNTTDIGISSAIYYLGYAGFQIPMGFFYERFGTKRILILCNTMIAISIFLHNITDIWIIAIASRLAIGIASAGGFLGVAKIVRSVFPSSYQGIALSLSTSLGLLGAFIAGKPLGLFIQHFGSTFTLWFCMGVALMFIIITQYVFSNKNIVFIIKDESISILPWKEQFKELLHNKSVIMLGLFAGLLMGPYEGFADVWGIPYLSECFGISSLDASLAVSNIYLGMVVGSPLITIAYTKFQKPSLLLSLCAAMMSSIFIILLLSQHLPLWVLHILMFVTGIFCSYQTVVFMMGMKVASLSIHGIVTSLLNCMLMIEGSLFHLIMGGIMDYKKITDLSQNGTHIYPKEAYTYAVAIIPISLIIGGALFFIFSHYFYKQQKN